MEVYNVRLGRHSANQFTSLLLQMSKVRPRITQPLWAVAGVEPNFSEPYFGAIAPVSCLFMKNKGFPSPFPGRMKAD